MTFTRTNLHTCPKDRTGTGLRAKTGWVAALEWFLFVVSSSASMTGMRWRTAFRSPPHHLPSDIGYLSIHFLPRLISSCSLSPRAPQAPGEQQQVTQMACGPGQPSPAYKQRLMEPKDGQSQEPSPAGQGGRGMWPAALGPLPGLGEGQPRTTRTRQTQGHLISRAVIQSALEWGH